MNKTINKVKKIILVIETFFIAAYSKSIAISPEQIYGVPEAVAMYGIQRPEAIPAFWKVLRGLIIPVIFIIGAVVYFKKSSSSTLRKIITIIISLIIVVLIVLGINYMLKVM